MGLFYLVLDRPDLAARLKYTTAVNPQASLAAVLERMTDPDTCLAQMCQSAERELQRVGKALDGMARKSERQFEGVWGGAVKALDFVRDPWIAAHTTRSDLRFTDLQYGRQPVALYLVAEAPTDMQYLYGLFRIILQLAGHQLMAVPVRYRRRRRELLWLLNEMPTLGYMPLLEQWPCAPQ
jgi:type IV secretory pathway TraG/TraD family ATPase VirD4